MPWRAEDPPEDWTPELNFGVRAGIPAGYVAEDEIRLNLHARLAKARSGREIEDFAAEIEDRFGPVPDEVANLFALARLARSCRLLGIARIDAGPQAIALTFRRRGKGARFEECDERLSWRGDRLVLAQPIDHPERRLREAAGLLRRFRLHEDRAWFEAPLREAPQDEVLP